jgi:hypothetical protein
MGVIVVGRHKARLSSFETKRWSSSPREIRAAGSKRGSPAALRPPGCSADDPAASPRYIVNEPSVSYRMADEEEL